VPYPMYACAAGEMPKTIRSKINNDEPLTDYTNYYS